MFFNKIRGRRGYIRIISFITAGFVICLTFALSSYFKAEKYKQAIEISYARSISELNDYMTNINSALTKSTYVGTDKQQSKIANSLWRDCSCAKSCLESLPYANETTDTLNKFLSQVGDYSMYLAERSSENLEITDEMYEQLNSLTQYSSDIKNMVNSMSLDLQQGTSWQAAQKSSGFISSEETPYITDGYYEFEEELTTYPTLIYDGPYSDQTYEKKSELLKNSDDVDREAARKIAAKFVGIPYENMTDDSDENGNLDSYTFNGSNFSVNVTKKGGFVSGMLNSVSVGTAMLNSEEAVQKASDFISSKGYNGFKCIGYETYEDICTVNMANVQNGVVIYTELIKVGVALDNGGITFFDATSYITNHKNRKIPVDIAEKAKAESVLNKNLTVKKSTLAVIPHSGTLEKLCYEFLCTAKDGTDVLVYVNAKNLSEEDILIVLNSEGSSLTI